VKAVLKNDTSRQHILVDHVNVIKYLTFPKDFKFHDIVDDYDRPAKILCYFGEELITDFHIKAGNDDFSKGWAKRAVKSVIEMGRRYLRIIM